MEAGGASSLVAISDQAGVPLAETQKELTPFQRMVLEFEMMRQQEEIENEHQTPSAGSAGPRTNPAAMSGGGTISGDTITYVNEGNENG